MMLDSVGEDLLDLRGAVALLGIWFLFWSCGGFCLANMMALSGEMIILVGGLVAYLGVRFILKVVWAAHLRVVGDPLGGLVPHLGA